MAKKTPKHPAKAAQKSPVSAAPAATPSADRKSARSTATNNPKAKAAIAKKKEQLAAAA